MVFAFNVPVFAQGLAIPENTTEETTCARGESANQCLQKNPIIKWINFFINLLASIIFVGATAMILYGAIMYTSAADNPQRLQTAKKTIANTLIGLAALFFLYAFLLPPFIYFTSFFSSGSCFYFRVTFPHSGSDF